MSLKKISDLERPATALIYVRVSTEEQTQGYSLQSQEKQCKEYVSRSQWKTIEVFRDEGFSAKTTDRPALKRMQEYCMKNIGRVGYVVVWRVDRFSRNTLDHLMLRK